MNQVPNQLFFGVIYGFVLTFQVKAMDIDNFFPDINGNLSKITWAHAVNNKTYLENSLNSSLMMLEADVVYGKINATGESMPIMGHPPATESDLSLQDFLTTTYNFNKDEKNRLVRKGVKLDFKTTEVFNKSVNILNQLYNLINYPIWINADIVNGPLNASTIPVDANIFLSTSRSFSKSVLSLGWTTTAPSENNYYTPDQISKMIDVIKNNNITQDITFAVRAGIAARSLDQMRRLKNEISNCTLTIWSSQGDNVDVGQLREVIFEYGVKRVYVDVPEELYEKLELGNSGRLMSGSVGLVGAFVGVILALFSQ